jgi:multicomponent Na+:H+ antiporter subunit G
LIIIFGFRWYSAYFLPPVSFVDIIIHGYKKQNPMLATIGHIIILVGAFFTLSGILGIIKFPNIFSKIHASSVADAVGIPIMLFGLALVQITFKDAAKILLMIPLLWLLAPIATQLLAKAAYKEQNRGKKDEI